MSATIEILTALYRSNGQFVRLDLPAAELAELQQLGYDIETHPHFGYRIVTGPDRLMADDLRARLQTQVIGREILVFEETTSTNDAVERLARSQPHEGLVVFAESQSKGRGRHARPWVSPRGKGLWFSVLLRPKFSLSRVTVAASVAVARVAGREARIKWPNDVTLHGRKLAGILTETRQAAAILGIGLNVNCRDEDFPVDLRKLVIGMTGVDRPGVAVQLLTELDALYAQAVDDFPAISAEWARLCTTLGKQIAVRMGERRIEGHAQALDEDGALLIRRDNGQIERVLGADLVLERT
ncbi:MAG: biotin--[acetyl-CoA-carboxylase] ligase [Verrucomicrobiota bacterium]